MPASEESNRKELLEFDQKLQQQRREEQAHVQAVPYDIDETVIKILQQHVLAVLSPQIEEIREDLNELYVYVYLKNNKPRDVPEAVKAENEMYIEAVAKAQIQKHITELKATGVIRNEL